MLTLTVMNVAFAVGRCCVRETGRRRNAAAYGDEVSAPALERSNGNSDWWYMYTSTMLINNGDPYVQRECAAETVCCDRANLQSSCADWARCRVRASTLKNFSENRCDKGQVFIHCWRCSYTKCSYGFEGVHTLFIHC